MNQLPLASWLAASVATSQSLKRIKGGGLTTSAEGQFASYSTHNTIIYLHSIKLCDKNLYGWNATSGEDQNRWAMAGSKDFIVVIDMDELAGVLDITLPVSQNRTVVLVDSTKAANQLKSKLEKQNGMTFPGSYLHNLFDRKTGLVSFSIPVIDFEMVTAGYTPIYVDSVDAAKAVLRNLPSRAHENIPSSGGSGWQKRH